MTVENTKRTIQLSIDKEQIRKEIYAESACIALLSPADGRPSVITDDNRALVYVYIEKAFVELVSSLAAFVDAAGFSIPEGEEIIVLPLLVDGTCKAQPNVVRRMVENALSAAVLGYCYESRRELSATLFERRDSLTARLRRLLSGEGGRRCSTWL